MTPWGSKACRCHWGFGQKPRLHMSTWISGFITVWASSMDHTKMASCGIANHGGPLRRSNAESQTFLILDLYCCLEPGGSLLLSGRLGDWVCVCLSSRLLYTIPLPHPAVPTGWMTACRPESSLSPMTTIASPALPLSLALFFSIFSTCPSHICSLQWRTLAGACLSGFQLAGAVGSVWNFEGDKEYLCEALYCSIYRCVILIYVLENDFRQMILSSLP